LSLSCATDSLTAYVVWSCRQIDLRSSEEMMLEGMGSPAFQGLSFCKYKRDPAVNRVSASSSSSSRLRPQPTAAAVQLQAGQLCVLGSRSAIVPCLLVCEIVSLMIMRRL
jgi:hypothetical protein